MRPLFQDWLGQDVYAGDWIVYPTAQSSSVTMNLAEVVGFDEKGRLLVKRLREHFYRTSATDPKEVRLTAYDRATLVEKEAIQ